MLFSIIMPTYNRAAYIRATLDSLRAQHFSDYETIIVDDGSTDGTLELLRNYEWVKVLQQQNKGPGAARNFGVRQSCELRDRKSTRLNSSHRCISYAVFCLKKKRYSVNNSCQR